MSFSQVVITIESLGDGFTVLKPRLKAQEPAEPVEAKPTFSIPGSTLSSSQPRAVPRKYTVALILYRVHIHVWRRRMQLRLPWSNDAYGTVPSL